LTLDVLILDIQKRVKLLRLYRQPIEEEKSSQDSVPEFRPGEPLLR
jgi:hypothetical protein